MPILLFLVLIPFMRSSAATSGRALRRTRSSGRRRRQPAKNQARRGRPATRWRREGREDLADVARRSALDGRDIKYTATAGTLPIRLDDGKVAARMFFVAYTKDGEDAKTRPVSFLYNGGPGSATVWLHMGSFAPRRAQMADEGFQPAPPYQLVDNENSLIDVSDLVFVDAIDTGYSRAMAGREQRAVPRPGRRHPRLRRVHRRVPEDLQPLAVAEVPDRRELRHDPVGRPRRRSCSRATASS